MQGNTKKCKSAHLNNEDLFFEVYTHKQEKSWQTIKEK